MAEAKRKCFTFAGTFQATFTNLGATGRLGPANGTGDQYYDGEDHEHFVVIENGIQKFTVQMTGQYIIQVAGEYVKLPTCTATQM